MNTIADLIAAARKRPTAHDKLDALLLKVRKGATAAMTMTNVVSLVDRLGWKIEPVAGWVQMHSDEKNLRYVFNTDAEAHAKALKEAVKELPERVTIGKTVISDVTVLRVGSNGKELYFKHKEWRGAEGYKVTSADGQSANAFPNKHDVMRSIEKQVSVHDLFRALNKLDLKAAVSQLLGMEEHVPAEFRSRENTGTCGACWGNYKLDERGRMVLHGYRRPGWGHVTGECSAVKMPPLETSPVTAEYWLKKILLPQLAKEEEVLSQDRRG
jgi:hypothetical protein